MTAIDDDDTAGPPGPLSDLVVLDMTVARAGPTAVRQLADWGANVIRVEPPDGADIVGAAADERDPDHLNLHRNKRGLGLDLKNPDGLALFKELVEQADVLVENWRAPVKHRLGVDYDSLSALNPRLIYGSISGFGQDGPYADRGGVDQIAQGLGGLMSITGHPGQGPVRVGIAISDMAAGMNLSIGILVALHERERSGRGQWVHTSLLESMVSMLDFQAARWTVNGDVPEQAGNDHPSYIPMGTFETADGHVNIAAPSGRLWRQFCVAIEAPELLEDERYDSGPKRSAARAELNATINGFLAARTTAAWVELLNEAGVPCGPVNRIDQTFADPQVQHLGIETPIAHPIHGDVSVLRHATNLTRTGHGVRRPSPETGEHTDEILAEFGIPAERIADLRAAGAIQATTHRSSGAP